MGCFSTSGLGPGSSRCCSEIPIGAGGRWFVGTVWMRSRNFRSGPGQKDRRGDGGKGKGREGKKRSVLERKRRERRERREEKRRSSEHFRELWSFSRVHAFLRNLLQQTALDKPFPMTLLWSFCAMVASQVLYLRPFTDGVQRSLGGPGVA
jgi:hypothetical protein